MNEADFDRMGKVEAISGRGRSPDQGGQYRFKGRTCSWCRKDSGRRGRGETVKDFEPGSKKCRGIP